MGFFAPNDVTCDNPKKHIFVLFNKTEICSLAQTIIYDIICQIIMHVKHDTDFVEHISVLMNKTKHMLTA
jgi:hypothetical protein